MRHCIFVLGTRAQLVKIAPVLRCAKESGLRHVVWFTGQHRESIEDLIEDFGLQSQFVLPATHKERSSIGRLIIWLPKTFFGCFNYVKSTKLWSGKRPLVVVHGDTLSTWLGALAGRLGGGDIAHLESGLSSGRWNDPFPEELLRRMTFRHSRFAFCPNAEAAERMRRYRGCIVVETGENTLLDSVRFAINNATRAVASERSYYVASIHRFGNIYNRGELARIVNEICAISKYGDVHFILHPATELRLKKYGLYETLNGTQGVQVRPRMPYTEFLSLLGDARGVFSDGGSNQEELSYLGVPTILYRERSERPDGLGRNVILRGDIDSSLETFIESGRFDALRRETLVNSPAQPSRITVDKLLSVL